VRERNPEEMGEAPVKYELTGASEPRLEPKLNVWRRSVICLLGTLGKGLGRLFSVIGVSPGINRVSR
jgi:hypothetical protein